MGSEKNKVISQRDTATESITSTKPEPRLFVVNDPGVALFPDPLGFPVGGCDGVLAV